MSEGAARRPRVGVMGGTLLEGILSRQLLSTAQVWAATRTPRSAERAAQSLGLSRKGLFLKRQRLKLL